MPDHLTPEEVQQIRDLAAKQTTVRSHRVLRLCDTIVQLRSELDRPDSWKRAAESWRRRAEVAEAIVLWRGPADSLVDAFAVPDALLSLEPGTEVAVVLTGEAT